LSNISDFTAYTKCFYRDGLFYFFHKFYIPAEQIAEKYKSDNINIKQWIDSGIVTAIPGATIDYDYIERDIKEDSEKFDIIEL
jgi:phage terminase large subunit-like protein